MGAIKPLDAAQFGNFTYTDHGASITITDYSPAPDGTVVIPSSIGNKPVTEIGACAFEGLPALTFVAIPPGVLSIAERAFYGCGALRAVYFMGNEPNLGPEVFGAAAVDFTVYFFNDKSLFGSPAWQGYPASSMGASSPATLWLLSHGCAFNANLEDDPDHDGVNLLLAYALDLDPRQNLGASMPRPVVAEGQFTLTFDAANPDVTYRAEASDDLETWSSAGVILSEPDAANRRTASVPTALPRRFMRIAVSHPAPAWTPDLLPNLRMHFRADQVMTAAGAAPSDGGGIQTVTDLSGNGNHLTSPGVATRPVYSATGGPAGKPCVVSDEKLVGRAALAAAIVNPTVVFVGRCNSARSGVGDIVYDSDDSPRFRMQANVPGLWTFGTATGSSGLMAVPFDGWMMHTMETATGAGRWAVNDGQFAAVTGNLGVCTPDSFYLGAAAPQYLHSHISWSEIWVVEGGISVADMSRLRSHVAAQYGYAWSSEASLSDTFSRADTSDSNLGKGETRHGWAGQATSARILNGTSTIVAPWNTSYAYPQINFAPSGYAWDYTSRNEGGPVRSVGATLITKTRQSLFNMFHMPWGVNGWRLERFVSDGTTATTHVVNQRVYAGAKLAGTMRVDIDWAGGLVRVTDAEGVTTVCNWNAHANEPLINFKTPFLCFEQGIQSVGTPGDVIQYTSVRAW